MATVSILECQKRALKMEAQLIALEGAIMSMRSAAKSMAGQDGEAIRWQATGTTCERSPSSFRKQRSLVKVSLRKPSNSQG
jgi:hypothetical protein